MESRGLFCRCILDEPSPTVERSFHVGTTKPVELPAPFPYRHRRTGSPIGIRCAGKKDFVTEWLIGHVLITTEFE